MRADWGVAIFFAAAALALNAPLVRHLGRLVPSDLGDPLLNTWILWWNAQHVPWSADYWNAPAFGPAPYALALSETLLGLSWLTTPLQWAGISPLAAYNTLFIVSPFLNGVAAYALALSVTGRRDAALAGAASFAFAPYRAGQLGHVQTTATFFIPLALVALHRFWTVGRPQWLVVLAASVALNGLVSAYQLLYFGLLFGFLTLCAAFSSSRDWKKLGLVTGAMLAGMAALAPILLTYQRIHDHWRLQRSVGEMQEFSADLTSWLQASDRLAIPRWNEPFWKPEGDLYPGLVLLAVVALGAVIAWRRRQTSADPPWLEAICGLVWIGAALLMLGPQGRVMGQPFWDHAPFSWLIPLPGFSTVRVPARLAIIQMVAGSMLASLILARVLRPRSWQSVAAAILAAMAFMADGWYTLPVVDAPLPFPRPLTADLVMELPSRGWAEDVPAMYRGIFHGRRVVNGYSGYLAPHYLKLQRDLESGCFESLDALRRGRSLDVVVWVNEANDIPLLQAAATMWPGAQREYLPRAEIFHVPGEGDSAGTALDDPIDLRRYCRAPDAPAAPSR
jgi:hypothetical protein